MTAGYALAIKRLYGSGIVRVASKHNLREIAAEIGVDGHIDPARVSDNIVMRGPATAEGVTQLAKSLMDAAGVTKCRKTAVMALELLFTLPAGTVIDPRRYFEQAISWAERHFGVPVLSCVVHLDEGAPHAHALLLPLVDGRMGGSDLHGGKAKLWAMQTSFHEEVGGAYGLARQAPQKRISAPARIAAIELARVALQANSALTDAIVDALLAPHAKDPAPLLLALGIAMPSAKTKRKPSFVAMMTAPCALEPRNPIGKANCNPIGKAVVEVAPESQPYTCVGIAFPTAPNSRLSADVLTVDEPVDQHHRAESVQNLLPTSASPADQATPTTCTAPAKRKPAAANRQPLTTAPALGGHLEAVSSAQPGGVRKISDTPQAVHQLDTPAADDVQALDGGAAAPGQVDVSNSARISHPCGTGGAGEDVSRFGAITQGGSDSRPPAGVPSFGQTTTATGSDALETQQVDQQAGHADAQQRSPSGGGNPSPRWGMVPEAEGDYHRHRDDEQPAGTWCADLGEFVQATGPPRGACHLYP